jgi:hypothetical protein
MLRYLLGPDARTQALTEALDQHARIAITGGPWTGKTTLVEGVNDREIVHTDVFKDEPWDAQPDLIIAACAPHARFVVEGCQVPRALRKGLEVDVVIWLVNPVLELDPKRDAKRIAFGKGVSTVFESIREKLTVPVLVVP